jgi:hypothetical protein
MSSFALFIDTPDTNQETSQDIQDQVKQIGLTFQSCATVEAALAAFEEQSLAGNKPEIILLGPNLTSPIATARSLFRAAPLAHLAFLTQGSNGRLLKQLESPVAMIGTYWSIIDLEDDDVQENLASGSISARQRLQLRTTLDANRFAQTCTNAVLQKQRVDLSGLLRQRLERDQTFTTRGYPALNMPGELFVCDLASRQGDRS